MYVQASVCSGVHPLRRLGGGGGGGGERGREREGKGGRGGRAVRLKCLSPFPQ